MKKTKKTTMQRKESYMRIINKCSRMLYLARRKIKHATTFEKIKK